MRRLQKNVWTSSYEFPFRLLLCPSIPVGMVGWWIVFPFPDCNPKSKIMRVWREYFLFSLTQETFRCTVPPAITSLVYRTTKRSCNTFACTYLIIPASGFSILHSYDNLCFYGFHTYPIYAEKLTHALKGIDRPFRGGVESILIRSLLVIWRLGYFLNLILKGLLHKIRKKPLDAA